MKGILYSSDFVIDQNDNLRLLEINTDTAYVSTTSMDGFDYTEFISVLQSENITEVCVIYKDALHTNIYNHLSQSLLESAPFITTITPIVVSDDSIFPPSPDDSPEKFILRLAYDETAIVDSIYAKGTLNILKLFADNGDTGSIVNFYHSSSAHGVYNTIETFENPTNIVDFAIKNINVDHSIVDFYKMGMSGSSNEMRIDNFIQANSTPYQLIQQYVVNPNYTNANKMNSVRSYNIVYGSELETIIIASYEIDAVLELPIELQIDNELIGNLIPTKHYYEYATNTINSNAHGLLGDEMIVDDMGNEVALASMVTGSSYESFYVSGSPDTDNDDLIAQWSYPGNTLPSGSDSSTSVFIDMVEMETYVNQLIRISFEDGESIEIGPANRLLVYDSVTDLISYKKSVNVAATDFLFSSNGSLIAITSVDLLILEENQTLYTPNMEQIDTFVIGGNKMVRLIAHNPIFGCFVGDTKITMADGSEKNIEDIIIGDEVLSFNGIENEAKPVINVKAPIHQDIVKYVFSNQTEVICTYDHPFFIESGELASYTPFLTNKRYELDKDVKQIKVGDMVFVNKSKSRTAIKDIIELDLGDTQTHIFTVEDNHNFYANGILVHNK